MIFLNSLWDLKSEFRGKDAPVLRIGWILSCRVAMIQTSFKFST